MCETFVGQRQLDAYGKALISGNYAYNNYPGQERLHFADCTYIAADRKNILVYEKIVCADDLSCILGTLQRRGLPAKAGGCCERRGLSITGAGRNRLPARQISRPTQSARQQDAEGGFPSPCKESVAEDEVAAYLEQRGYSVRRQVSGPTGGIIDLVATKGNETLIIEAKGEDKGGYGTAEMNFQMGLGQILSRMTGDGEKAYIAFPLTPDFLRILRRYTMTPAFERIPLGAFVALAPGKVERVEGPALRSWIVEHTGG